MLPSLNFLILEDNEDDLTLMLQQLRRSDLTFDYHHVYSEEEFLKALKNNEWDIILSDFNLPGFSACGALAIAKANCPDTPFILVSGTVGETTAVEQLHGGAADFIMKDNLSRLIPAIKRELKNSEIRREQQTASANLKIAAVELQKAQKLESLGRLAGGIAHDFNSILTAIVLNADSMSNPELPNTVILERLSEVKKAADRGASLVRQLLTFSRNQHSSPSDVDLNGVIGKLKPMLTQLIGERIKLQTDLYTDLPCVRADPSQIEQILMNLVLNARDAIADSGEIQVRTILQDCPPFGFSVILFVSDNGAGMSEEIQSKIFEPFFSTKRMDKGNGLGLSIVYGIVKKAGGEIVVSSKEGEGTVFRVSFPVVEPDDSVNNSLKNEQFESTSIDQRLKVLLVEDDASLRKNISDQLESMGYLVDFVDNGLEALRKVTLCTDYNLLISDIIMSEMHGTELLVKIRNVRPDIKVLLISEYKANDISHLFDSNTTVLPKPFESDDLKTAVINLVVAHPEK